jgi:hypothetical protein
MLDLEDLILFHCSLEPFQVAGQLRGNTMFSILLNLTFRCKPLPSLTHLVRVSLQLLFPTHESDEHTSYLVLAAGQLAEHRDGLPSGRTCLAASRQLLLFLSLLPTCTSLHTIQAISISFFVVIILWYTGMRVFFCGRNPPEGYNQCEHGFSYWRAEVMS